MSNIVLVKKKDGGHRFAVDYRALNGVTKKDKFPLPNIEDLLGRLKGSKYFTSCDLFSAYFQVPLAEDSKSYTAFTDGENLWEFNVLSFGLCNAPGTFARMATNLFQGFKQLLVYLDDLMAHDAECDDHLKSVRALLDKLRETGLTFKKVNVNLDIEN